MNWIVRTGHAQPNLNVVSCHQCNVEFCAFARYNLARKDAKTPRISRQLAIETTVVFLSLFFKNKKTGFYNDFLF